MLKKQYIQADRLLIVIIVIIAAFLRFWHFAHLPFMHDEFSAIFRTRFNSISDVIEIGVKQNDSHPAGVQLFIYFWIKLFGLSEPVLKLPFTLLGVGSIYIIWLIAKRWFNTVTGLFSATLLAVIQYTIFYSQLARPYAPGLFFSLATVWFWTQIIFDENPKKADWIGFVIFMAINSYIHAFTLFLNLLIAITGLFFVKGNRLKAYLWAGLAVFVLYLPGIPVFMAQLGRGDIGGWLSTPKPDFLFHYFYYIFHFSLWFFILTITIVIFLSIKYFVRDRQADKFRIIGISWFVITFLVAYLYSIYRSPILQYSTLLFVFPFIVMVAFSFIGKVPVPTISVSLLIIVFAGVTTLIGKRFHYEEMYHQGFDQIPKQINHDLIKYKNHSVAVVLQSTDTRMFDYYFGKYGETPEYFKLEKSRTLAEVNSYIKNISADMVLFGWDDYAPLNYLEAIKASFPYVVKQKSWFNSEYWVLSKHKLQGRYISTKKVVDSIGSYKIYANNKYGKAIKIETASLNFDRYSVLNAQVAVRRQNSVPDAIFVFDWRDSDDNTFFWEGSKFKNFVGTDSIYFVNTSLRIADLPLIPTKGEVKFYIWKRDTSKIEVQQMKVYVTQCNPVEVGLFENIYP